jgi:soluble lytic murein transglycosylase-like protein
MRIRLLLVALLIGSSCSLGETGGPEGAPVAGSPSPSPSPTVTSETEAPKAFAPAPERPLPREPGRLAGELRKVDDALKRSVPSWRASGRARPPMAVVLQSLYQQRIYRLMSRNTRLGNGTLRRLDGLLGRSARRIVGAHRELRGLVEPLPANFSFPTGRAKPAEDLLRYYKFARRRFGVNWQVLAAINYVETKFGKVKATSSAGAKGPMQFMPATWRAYGLGGNVRNDRDAIMGAANYLRASGATRGPAGLRRALWAYNHSDHYVRSVLDYMRYMKSRIRHYFTLYNWQVFVVTTRGDKRLTGPGL